jgi:hypothetical protein
MPALTVLLAPRTNVKLTVYKRCQLQVIEIEKDPALPVSFKVDNDNRAEVSSDTV